MNNHQHGSSHVSLVVLLVLLIAGALGFVFWQRITPTNKSASEANANTFLNTNYKPVVPDGWKKYYTPYWSVGFAAPASEQVGASMMAGPVDEKSLSGLVGTPIGLNYDPVKREMVEYDYDSFEFENKVPTRTPYLKKADTKVMDSCDAYYYDTNFKLYPGPFQKEDEPTPNDYTGIVAFCDHPKTPYMLEYEFENIYSKDMIEKFFKTILIKEEEILKG